MTDPFVPAAPHLWSWDHPWNENVSTFMQMAQHLDEELNNCFTEADNVFIDELAILAPSQDMVMQFINDAVQHGWVFFNRASDTVRAEPFGAVYNVEYYFLKHQDYPWRFEVMRKVNGVSPVHDALKSFTDQGMPLVHASFKPAYGETMDNYAWTQGVLNAAGYCLAQECRSTYGAFGYWRSLEDLSRLWYLKPRVNQRDAMPSQGSLSGVEVRR